MRIWIIGAFALLISIASTHPTHATAFAGGTLWAGFSLTNRGSGSLEGLSYTAIPKQQSAFGFAEGNASAVAFTGGIAGLTGGADRMNAGASINLGVRADAFGHAIAAVSQIVEFAILNTSNEQIIFDVRASYGINTGVYVDDILTESVLAYWNVGVRFDDPPYPYAYGEFGRTIDCSYPLSNSSACPNFYDSNDDMGGRRYTLDPGENLEGELITIARYEATAVPEPSTLVLLATAGFGLFTFVCRGRA